jgi:hypothetical protein
MMMMIIQNFSILGRLLKAHQRKGGGRGVKFRRTLMTDDFPLLPSSIIIKDDD